jgi:hypothetical protein
VGDPPEERVIHRERFQSVYFDFRGKSVFARYDCCEFVKCTLLIDATTEQLAFTPAPLKTAISISFSLTKNAGFYVVDNLSTASWKRGGSNSRNGWPKPLPLES